MTDSRVDFPEPDGPPSATNSLGTRVSDTPLSATIPPSKTRVTSSTATRAPARRLSLDLDGPVEILGKAIPGFDDDAEHQWQSEGLLREPERIPVPAVEVIRRAAGI